MSKLLKLLCFGALLFAGQQAFCATPAVGPSLSININGGNAPADFSVAVQLVLFMTLLSVAPSLVILMTSFTRIIIVLSFVRNAIGVSAPSSQIIVGLSLFLTFFLMGPIWEKIYDQAMKPYMEEKITSEEALDIGSQHMKRFMLRQTRSHDLEFFLELSKTAPTDVKNLPIRVVIPAFIISELRTAFQMGFMVFVPFLVIDFLIASTLMSMGMMMMPPAIIALPFKLLLFVLVDGWYLIVKSLVQSFS
ncbi:MAG: flagellar biosynthetic protein FliP [Verrucomicrobia bacterium GWF2_51_19]|nr:MAG: flagellar biosynthetic protein FliP [Verrucomicrobia bacterium GWF2_51_19]HCJ12209.1 flagellar biosynthetic protein FliP [Opitutae bacterium]